MKKINKLARYIYIYTKLAKIQGKEVCLFKHIFFQNISRKGGISLVGGLIE